MIPLLRAAAFLLNVCVFAGVPLLLGASLPLACGCAVVLFCLSWWACGLHPRGTEPGAEPRAAAFEIARRLGAPDPSFVSEVPGWTAASVRAGANCHNRQDQSYHRSPPVTRFHQPDGHGNLRTTIAILLN